MASEQPGSIQMVLLLNVLTILQSPSRPLMPPAGKNNNNNKFLSCRQWSEHVQKKPAKNLKTSPAYDQQ